MTTPDNTAQTVEEELRKDLVHTIQNTPAEHPVYTVLAEEITKRVMPLIQAEVTQKQQELLDELKKQAIEAQYYIPNSADDTYTSGEVVRISTIEAKHASLGNKEKA